MRPGSSDTKIRGAVTDLPESLQDIFANTFECVARVDQHGCYLSVNAAYAEVCGYSQEEMTGMSWRETVHPDDRELAEHKYGEVLDTGRSEVQLRGIRKNASVFYKQLLMVKGLESDTSSVQHYCFINDITARLLDELTALKSVKAGLELQEQHFHNLFKDIPGVVFRRELDDDWSFNYLSAGIEKLTGIPSYQLLESGNTNFASLILDDDRESVKQIVAAAISSKDSYTIEYRIQTVEGEVRWLRERATSNAGEHDQDKWIGGIISDITDSKLSEKQFQIAKTLIENADDIVLWLNWEGQFIYANNMACEVLGYERNELLALSSFDVDENFSPENRRKYLETLNSYPSGSIKFETTARRKDNSEVNLEIQSNVVELDGDKFICVLAKDISARQKIDLSFHLHQTILQLLVANTPQQRILDTLCDLIEEIIPQSKVALFAPDENGRCLKLLSSPNLPRHIAGAIADILPVKVVTGNYNHEDMIFEGLIHGTDRLSNRVISSLEKTPGRWIAPFYVKGKEILGSILILLEHDNPPAKVEIEFLKSIRNVASLVLHTADMHEAALRFDKIIEAADDLIIYVDSDYRFRAVSNRYAEVHNKTREEIIGKFFPDIVGVELFQNNIKPYLDRSFAGAHLEFKDWFEIAGKDLGYFHVKLDPVRDEKSVIGVIVIMRDSTEIYNISTELRDTKNRYQEIIEKSADIMVISRFHDGKIKKVNRAFTRLIEYTEEEVIGTPALKIYAKPADRKLIVDKLTQHDYCSEFETLLRSKNGNNIPVVASSNLIEYDDEPCIFSVIHDITERKIIEDELNAKNRSINLLQGITEAANEAASVEKALWVALKEICEFCDWPVGHAYILDTKTGLLQSCRVWHIDNPELHSDFRHITEQVSFESGVGLPGRILAEQESVWITDISSDENFPRAKSTHDLNIKSAFGFPVMVEDKVVAVLEFFNHMQVQRDNKLLEVLEPIGVQIGRIIERKQAALALQQSQINFSKAIDASPDSVVIVNMENGKILDLNDAVLEATYYSRDYLIEHGNGAMFWTDQVAFRRYLGRLKKDGRVANYSMLSRRKDGTNFPCLMSTTVINVDGSKCAFSIVKDISDLTIAYEQIHESKKQTQIITDTTSVCISYVDTELRYIFNNMEFEKELGITNESITGKTIREVVGAKGYEYLEPYLHMALSGSDVKFEYAFINPGGQQNVYELTYHPDRKDNVIQGIYIASSNITDRKETEAALRKTNRALLVLSESNNVLVKEHREDLLLQAICELAVKSGGYHMAWIDYSIVDEFGKIQSFATKDDDRDLSKDTFAFKYGRISKQLSEQVLLTGRPSLIRTAKDMGNNLKWRAEVLNHGHISALGLPLQSRGEVLGVIAVASEEVDSFDEEEINLLAGMAENLAYGIQSIRETDKRKKAEDLLALENLAFQMLSSSPDLPELLGHLLLNIDAKLVNYDCSVMLLREKDQCLYNSASPGINMEYIDAIDGLRIGEKNEPCGQAACAGTRLVIDDVSSDRNWQDYRELAQSHHLRSCCTTPMLGTDGRVLGVFSVYGSEPGSPDDYQLQIIDRMAQIIGGAIEQYKTDQALLDNEERFALAMKGSQDGLWDLNLETGEAYWSPRWKSMLGYEEHELIPGLSGFQELLHPDNLDVHEKILQNGHDNFEIEFKMKHKDGHYVDILSRSTGIRAAGDKKVTRIVGTHVDLTERIRTAAQIMESERRFRTLYDDSPSMFFTLNKEGIILSINKYGAAHLGFDVHELIDKSILDITHPDDGPVFIQKLKACEDQPSRVQRCEIRKKHKFGDVIWVRASMRSTGLDKNQQTVLVTCEDISEARILSEQLEHQAKHDALTGLINRMEFEKRLRRVLNSELDNADHALCYLDLDQFKVINDTCGHLAGDELLRRISDVLNTVIRKRDTLARMGGDEFAVLLEHCPLDQAKRVAEELLRCVESLRFVWEGKRFTLGVSIGLVPMRAGGGTVVDILSAADEACYAAKDSGRNRIHVYHSDDMELSRRRGEMEWVSKINHALEEGRFCLAMQNIGSLHAGKEMMQGNHYELLLRMQGDDGRLIYPGAFLPAAERYNLSVKIDRWVVSRTLEWLGRDIQELEALSICSINLSGHSMGDDSFLQFLLDQFEQSPVPPTKICFEITETAAIANLGAAIQFIHALKGIGCLFALDDFGTGVSSFNYLKNLPVDFLKIDGAFIRQIHNDLIDFAMVRSINEIGQVMGKLTIAEFVESDAILEVVRKIGINYAQGYAIGKPAPINFSSPF